MCLFFFFKQKTAYEMRISDWSSDVCSSDLSLHRWGARNQYTLVELLNLGSAEQESSDLDNALQHIRQAAAGLAAIGGEGSPTPPAERVDAAPVLGRLGRNAKERQRIANVDKKAYQAPTYDPGRAAVLKEGKQQNKGGMGDRGTGEY